MKKVLRKTVSEPVFKGLPDSSRFEKRLQKELAALVTNCPPGVQLNGEEISENLLEWNMQINGAPGTLYQDEKFVLRFRFSQKYPFEAPMVVFIEPNIPVHPHIYSNGHICLSILGSDWSPALNVEAICISIISMLSSCKEKARPDGDELYVRTCQADPRKTGWLYHDDAV